MPFMSPFSFKSPPSMWSIFHCLRRWSESACPPPRFEIFLGKCPPDPINDFFLRTQNPAFPGQRLIPEKQNRFHGRTTRERGGFLGYSNLAISFVEILRVILKPIHPKRILRSFLFRNPVQTVIGAALPRSFNLWRLCVPPWSCSRGNILYWAGNLRFDLTRSYS